MAAAQAGDLDAAIRFCRSLKVADHEWGQPTLWLDLIVPQADGSLALSLLLSEGPDFISYARGIAES